jgi:Uma2 family endonuclease
MMTTTTVTEPATKLLTAEEFAALPEPADGSKQELVRGEIVTMPPTRHVHGLVQGHFYFHLRLWANQHKLGNVTVESGLPTETDPDTVRGPDVAYWSFERLPADQVPEGYPEVAADLVVEVLSPSDSRRRMAEKIREYFAAGVRLVWVADPDDRTVTVYTRPGDGIVLWSDATLTGGDVLPSFSCPVASLFESV